MHDRIIIRPEEVGVTSGKRLEIRDADITPPEAEQLGIHWGAPDKLDTYGRYPLSDTPRIHPARLDIVHNNGTLAQTTEQGMIFAAHGYRSQEGKWVLRDGREVVELIEEWNRIRPDLQINFAVVCNPTEGVAPHLTGVGHASGTNLEMTAMLEGIVPTLSVRMSDPEGVITSPSGRKIIS